MKRRKTNATTQTTDTNSNHQQNHETTINLTLAHQGCHAAQHDTPRTTTAGGENTTKPAPAALLAGRGTHWKSAATTATF